jgi:hypothetical protein
LSAADVAHCRLGELLRLGHVETLLGVPDRIKCLLAQVIDLWLRANLTDADGHELVERVAREDEVWSLVDGVGRQEGGAKVAS